MASQPSDPRLPAHNARVLRLARDCDKKYRPVLIPIAKHMNLETGDSFPKVATIQKESARYTDDRTPLSRASVFRLLAEMRDLGALKTEARFGPTGRQRSSYRYLDVHVAIRFGQPVEHLWDAPLSEDETPHETPGETLDETPITLLELSSDSRKNSPSNSSLEMKIVGDNIPSGEEGEEAAGYNNSYFTGKSRKRPNGYFRKASGAPRRGESVVDLSPDEARFMWASLGSHADRLAFLKASANHRASLMERAAQRAAEARAETERKARERAEREEAERQERLRAERQERIRAEEERRQAEQERQAKVRQEIDGLFDEYAMAWADRGMDRAREIAHGQIDHRLSRGRVDEVLAEMKRTIAKNAEWIAEYKADPAQVMARLAKEEADREANRQAEADKKARDATRAKTLDDLFQQYRDLTGKHADVNPLKGYDAMVEQLTRQIEEHGPRP